MPSAAKKAIFMGIASVIMWQSGAFALRQADLQLSVAFPDPVKSGEKITFQVVVMNTGSETWTSNMYSVYAEIYDSREKYLTKTDILFGNVAVGPSNMAVLYLPYTVPQDEYEGLYKYRIVMNYENRRILYSDFLSYSVSSAAQKGSGGPQMPFKLNGKGIFSYRNSDDLNWENYMMNLNLGLLGQFFDHPVTFKFDSGIAPDGFRLNNILLNFRLSAANISAGDVMPVFSSLSFSNTGVRGFLVDSKPGIMEFSGVFASSVTAYQGSDTSSGSFARYTIGGRAGIDPYKDLKIGVSCVYSADDPGSLAVPGTVLKPVMNAVLCSDISWVFLKNFMLEGEYAVSEYSADAISDPVGTGGNAYRTTLSATLGDFTAGVTYKNIGTTFSSLNSPYSISDRAGAEGIFTYGTDLVKIYLLYGRYGDNLSDDPAKIRTSIDDLSAVVSLTPQDLPAVTAGYTWNSLVAADAPNYSLVNNTTRGVSLGISHKLWGTGISASGQLSEFRDITLLPQDVVSASVSAKISRMFGPAVAGSVGASYTRLNNIVDPLVEESIGTNAGVNVKVIPEQFVLSGWVNVSRKTDNAATKDNLYLSLNTEGTYNLTRETALTAGFGIVSSTDAIVPSSSYQSWNMGTRLSYNF